ncbi:hypothetical protein GGF43_003683, partial [Coemansia sp. RSA 2618]
RTTAVRSSSCGRLSSLTDLQCGNTTGCPCPMTTRSLARLRGFKSQTAFTAITLIR